MPKLNGFVKLHRSLLDWEWHNDPATLSVWVHLLLMANHAPSEWRGIDIQRGQLIAGRKALAEQTGLSEQSVRTALNHLKSTGEIAISSTNKFSLVTIVNYGVLQGKQMNPTSTLASRSTIDKPAANQQSTTNKKEEKIKKKGNRGTEPPPAVLAFDGTDLSENLQQHERVESLIRRYGLPCTDAARDALLEDFERCGAAAVEAALKDKRGGVSIAFYRAFLNHDKEGQHGATQKDIESSWHIGNVV